MRRLATLCFVWLAFVSSAHARVEGDDARALAEAALATDELRLEDAAPVLDRLLAAHPDDPNVLFEHGLMRYHQGDYGRARVELLGSVVRATALRDADERFMLARIAFETEDATHAFSTLRSEDRRFEVRYASGDARMAGYALDVLRRVDEGLEAELGYRHPGPVRLDILPTTQHLARVSSLTVEEIETTGTIALCKWDRLIITSPRALVYGYPWADTVGHEYVHLVLARMTHDRAPVWVQEGYARFLERRWRGEAAHVALDPRSAQLLATAVSTDQLLPFERLHPSIARLPSAELAALAFAQVSTFVESFRGRHGAEGLRQVAARIAAGTDARDAFAEVGGEPWTALERAWRDELRARPAPATAADLPALRFRHGSGEIDETAEVARQDARDALRLGDMLLLRGRHGAAQHEYERAYAVASEDPIVATRLARAAHSAGDSARALAVLLPLRAAHPDHAPLLALIAASAAATGQSDLAREAALESIWLNPFDPEPHCALASVAEDASLAALASAQCGAR
ncbi:MAG: tetratricopeptide repeat protein [Deltaproteobacteria bacterium]|nr:tetratricopeptide repeat protein [Deltaproteobacteria bacterium]